MKLEAKSRLHAAPDDIAPPRCYLSKSEGKYRVIVQGQPICNDKATKAEALAAARDMKVQCSVLAWDGGQGKWIPFSEA